MQVLKFGGTSMGDDTTWRRVLDIVNTYKQPVVVVSATARTTRQLLAAAETAAQLDLQGARVMAGVIRKRHEDIIANFMGHSHSADTVKHEQSCIQWIHERVDDLDHLLVQIATTGELSPRTRDAVASLGEQLSSYLLVQCGLVRGIDMQWVDARRIIKTDSKYGRANPDTRRIDEAAKLLKHMLSKNQIPVLGGYYGEDKLGNVTTLGFEGSDFTASLIGFALEAHTIEIWTDVSGVFTCDPRVIPNATPIAELSFKEATDMAYFGAKVLHPSTMKPASQKSIPIFVKNIFEPDHPGTKIHSRSSSEGEVKALAFVEEIATVTVRAGHSSKGYEFLSRVFNELNNLQITVDAVTTTEASVSVALNKKWNKEVIGKLNGLGETCVRTDQALISLIGCRFTHAGQIADTVFDAISNHPVSMLSYCQATNNLNLVLPREHLYPAVKAIHWVLFEVPTKSHLSS